MDLKQHSVRPEELVNVGVLGLADTPNLSALALQRKFEETARQVVIPKHNALVETLAGMDGAGSIGAADPAGVEPAAASTVQAVLDRLQETLEETQRTAENAAASVWTEAQDLTAEQRARARSNIRAVGYDAQNIDPGQQLQARKNIGAASVTQLTEAMETSAQALQNEKEELRAKFGTPEVLEASVYSAADASYTPKALTLTENAVAGVTVHGVTNVWGTGEPAPDNACPIEGLGMLDTEYVLTGAENWQQDGAVYKYFIPETLYGEDPYTNQLCSHAPWGVGGSNVFARVYRADAGSYIAMGAGLYDCLAQQAAAGTPVKIWFRKTGHTAADPYYTGVKLEDAAGFHAFAVKTEQPLFSRSVLESDLLLDGKRCSRLTALYGQLLLDGTQEMWTDHSRANTVKVTLFADMKYSAAGDVRARCSRLPYNGDSTLDTPHFCFSESLGQVHLFLPKSVFAQQNSTEAVRAYFAAECAAGNPYVVVAPWQTEKVSYTEGETGVRNAAGTVTLETGGRTFITTWAAAREADLRALSAKAMRTDAQALTQEQQLQIRENIDAAKKNHAASSAEYGMGDSVNFGHVRLYESVTSRATTGAAVTPLAVYNAIRDAAAKCVSVGTQTLTEAQKAQVRANIGAAATGEGGSGGAPADWSAAEGTAGYIKNRTHWTEPRQTILEEVQTESGEEGYTALIMSPVGLEPGKTYVVVCDGAEYECVGQDISSLMGMPGAVGLGDLANLGMAGNGEPFIAMAASVELDPGVYGMIMTFSPCTVAIYGDSVHKLDNKYLDLDWLPKISTPATMFVGSLSTSSKQNGYLQFETPDTVSLVDGHTYDVRLNGDKYTCTCYTQLNNGNVVRLLGNAILADGVEDTGEPFCFVETKLDDVTVRMLLTVDYDWFELGASSIYLSVTGYGVLNRLPYELMPANVPYADDGAAILLPTFRQTFPAGQLTGLGELTMAPPQLNFVEGRTYTVTWDGAEYICEARRLEGEMDGAYMSAVVIGNAAVFGSADTEEPFLIGTLSSPQAADVLISLWDVGVKHEVSIHSGAVKRLNEACMPQAVNRIVLRSNINGSNKKFAITVNDQGELEVNAL